MIRTLDTMEDDLHQLVKAVDPHALIPDEAADALHALAVIARIATAGITKLALRAGESGRWRQQAYPDPGAWVADELGVTAGDGRRLHYASTRSDLCPDTWQQMTRGAVPPLKAAEIIAAAIATERARAAAARAAAARDHTAAGDEDHDDDVGAAPTAGLGKTVDDVERDLLDLARDRTGTLHRLRGERDKAEAAARDEAQAAIHAFLNRSVTFSAGHDGTADARLRLSNELMALIRTILEAKAKALFRGGGRGANGRAPTHANLLADALLLVLTGRLPAHPPGAAPGPTRRSQQPPPSTRHRPANGDRSGEPGSEGGQATGTGAASGQDNRGPTHTAPPTGTTESPSTAPAHDTDHLTSGGAPLGDDPHPELDLDDQADHPGAGSPVPRRSESTPPLADPQGEMILRVHAPALIRGRRLAGEVCEVVGAGPVTIGEARRLAHHACIDVVLRDRTGITTVAVTGRRLRRHLDLGPPPPVPPHRTRLILIIDAATIRGSGEQLHLPGTGSVSRSLLGELLSPAAISILTATAVDPDTVRARGRTYPRALAVAVREAHPVCHRCGFDRWQQTDHVLALALDGATRRANLSRPCTWCHAAKTRAEAPATTRAGRLRRRQRQQQDRREQQGQKQEQGLGQESADPHSRPASVRTRPPPRRPRRRTPSPADDP